MIKKRVTYIDFNGDEQTEDLYFNFTKAEVIDLKFSEGGDLEAKIKEIIGAKDNQEILRIFKELIIKSYGEKSADGKRFIKSDEMAKEFSQSAAFDEVFIEIASDEDKAAEFTRGILPQDLASKLEAVAASKN